jgi:hypothetical protein
MLLAATALGLGATLTTLYLGFEKEAEAAFGLLRVGIPMPFCRSAIRWAASGRFVELLSAMSSTRTGGVRRIGTYRDGAERWG